MRSLVCSALALRIDAQPSDTVTAQAAKTPVESAARLLCGEDDQRIKVPSQRPSLELGFNRVLFSRQTGCLAR